MYLTWRELLSDIAYGLGLLLAIALTLAFTGLALLCWGGVFAGTAAANSDGGTAIVFTFLAVFMGTMAWIATKR
jgi:hypothetical protein